MYFFRTRPPKPFQNAVLESITEWTHDDARHPRITTPSTALYSAQAAIGWSLFPRGFVSRHWRKLLDHTCNMYHVKTLRSPTDYISGIIQIMWQAQMTLWETHLEATNTGTGDSTPRQREQQLEFITRIRLLSEKREQCLHAHQTQYFHEDVEAFLSTATITQMKDYLRSYEPAIHQSIKDARRIPLRSLFTFPGFTQYRREHIRPVTLSPTTQTDQQQQQPYIHPTVARGPFPHKHTRWKQAKSLGRSIRDFFRNPPS